MIEEFGRKPEDLIMELATAGTPEAKARQAQQAREDEIRQLRAWQEREEANRKAFAEHQERQKKVQFRRSVEKQLITTAYSATKGPDGQAEERYPHLATFYKGHEQTLCQEADTIADQYRAATGLEATFEEICEYLEERNARWYKMMSSRPSRANGSQAAAGQMGGNLPQGTNQVRGSAAVSGRGLGPNVSSERRSLGSIQDLDGDERREAAMTAVRAAIAASGGR